MYKHWSYFLAYPCYSYLDLNIPLASSGLSQGGCGLYVHHVLSQAVLDTSLLVFTHLCSVSKVHQSALVSGLFTVATSHTLAQWRTQDLGLPTCYIIHATCTKCIIRVDHFYIPSLICFQSKLSVKPTKGRSLMRSEGILCNLQETLTSITDQSFQDNWIYCM